MNTTITRITGRGILLGGLVIMIAIALYSRGIQPGITFATYGIDLKIDSEATYNGFSAPSGTWTLKNLIPSVDKFWNFNDIKPGDRGTNAVSLHVKNSEAWMCLDFKNLTQNENGVNEPEPEEDINSSTNGELAEVMEF